MARLKRETSMTDAVVLTVTDRRSFVLGAAGIAALGLGASTAQAQDAAAIDALLKKVLGDAKPATSRVVIDLPEIAENGNTVPFAITVDSPMTDADSVKTLHIIATGNPQPDVAAFNFTPQSGKAYVSSRMRLGKTQDVYAIAQMSDGKFFMSKKTVKVTIGGCGG
jgi:sulfur-oxidizing protein SoxY